MSDDFTIKLLTVVNNTHEAALQWTGAKLCASNNQITRSQLGGCCVTYSIKL